jgi:GNAT superfamily N-acetyltransferase
VPEVRLATADDAGDVGRVLAEGFAADPVMTWVFDGPGRRAVPRSAGTDVHPRRLDRLAALDAATHAHHPEGDLWFLSSIATVEEAQGQGRGSALLEWSLPRVDADGLPAYLESTNPRNVSFYRRFGFVETATIELPGGPSLVGMWRPGA